jgi:beta-lactamase regulating signal transducer with metallopeptidase domain
MQLSGIFSPFANALAPIAVAGLWQGLVVAVAIALSFKATRRVSAAHRFAVWLGSFIAVAVVPGLPPLLSLFASPGGSAFSTGTVKGSHAWFQFDARWIFAIAVLWGFATALRAADLIFHVFRLRRLWRTATPIETATSVVSARAFQLCRTQFLDRPSLIGFFQPRILIPDWLLPRLSANELNQIVLHESTHLNRRDDWTNLFQQLFLILFPLNPGLWWIDRQLANEREMACDEAVVRVTQAPRAYAACLTRLAERGMAHRREALSLGAWQRRSELVSRVHRILRTNRGLSPMAARLLLGVFGCGLVGISVELASCPQLVAFIPAAHRATTLSSSTQFGDAVYSENPHTAALTAGARMVQTRAEITTVPAAKPRAGRARIQTGAVGELCGASSEPGAHKRRSTRVPFELAEAPQRIIVFTAWEQIDIAPASRGTIADYETPATSGGSSPPEASDHATAKHDADTSGARTIQGPPQYRETLLPLILRIVPQNSAQPTAIPIGDGWFVIQL